MITIIKKFGQILDKRQKKRIFLLFLITLAGSFLEILGVSLMLPMISAVMQPDFIRNNAPVAAFCKLFGIENHRTFFLVCIVALIAIFIFKDLFLMFESYAQSRFVCNNRFATQQRLLHIFLQRPYEYYLNASSGEIVRLVQEDAATVYHQLSSLLFMFSEVFVSLSLIVTILIIDWKITLFVTVMMLLNMLLIIKVIKPIMKKSGREYQENNTAAYKYLLQSISGIKEIKVAQKEAFFEQRYLYYGSRKIRAEKINNVADALPRHLIEMISICSTLTVIAIEIATGRDINALVPTLGAFVMAAVKLMPSANRIITTFSSISFFTPALDALVEHLNDLKAYEASNMSQSDTQKPLPLSISESFSLKDITYHYPNTEKNVLSDAGLFVPIGSSVGIVGVSGAGKTTVVDILLGLLCPQSGSILIDGKPLENYSGWLSHIGYIPQMIFMMDSSIRENIAFGVEKDAMSEEQIWHCLQEAQLADFVRSLPNGLDTAIGEHGIRISGGQRQRIGIARALYSNPDILIFDEATSALDNETEAAIIDAVNSLHGKKTMVIIAHRLQTIAGCDMIYRVADEKIVRER